MVTVMVTDTDTATVRESRSHFRSRSQSWFSVPVTVTVTVGRTKSWPNVFNVVVTTVTGAITVAFSVTVRVTADTLRGGGQRYM